MEEMGGMGEMVETGYEMVIGVGKIEVSSGLDAEEAVGYFLGCWHGN